jgi:hypothetical protein
MGNHLPGFYNNAMKSLNLKSAFENLFIMQIFEEVIPFEVVL